MNIIKLLILCAVMLYGAITDIRRREVDNFIPLMVGITALIGISTMDIPFMLLSAAVVFVPQLIIAMVKPSGYGGGDIKFTTACVFLLGIDRGLTAMILGLVLSLLFALGYRIVKRKRFEHLPLVPFYAIGTVVAYIL